MKYPEDVKFIVKKAGKEENIKELYCEIEKLAGKYDQTERLARNIKENSVSQYQGQINQLLKGPARVIM